MAEYTNWEQISMDKLPHEARGLLSELKAKGIELQLCDMADDYSGADVIGVWKCGSGQRYVAAAMDVDIEGRVRYHLTVRQDQFALDKGIQYSTGGRYSAAFIKRSQISSTLNRVLGNAAEEIKSREEAVKRWKEHNKPSLLERIFRRRRG